MIRMVFGRHIGGMYFYRYEASHHRSSLHKQAGVRRYRDVIFLLKVIHGEVNSMYLFQCIYFRVPCGIRRNTSTFYPSCMSSILPFTRIQGHFNNVQDFSFDIFCCFPMFWDMYKCGCVLLSFYTSCTSCAGCCSIDYFLYALLKSCFVHYTGDREVVCGHD